MAARAGDGAPTRGERHFHPQPARKSAVRTPRDGRAALSSEPIESAARASSWSPPSHQDRQQWCESDNLRVLPNRRHERCAFRGTCAHRRPRPGRSGQFLREIGRGVTEGGEQYTTVAAVAVTCCSSRPTVGDRPDQHVTVVATAMVRCRACPARSVATAPPRWHPALFDLRRAALSTISAPPPGNDQRMRFPSRTRAAPVRFCDHSRRSWTPRPRRRASVGIRQHPHSDALAPFPAIMPWMCGRCPG